MMLNELSALIETTGFMPHGYCLAWSPGLLALHVIADTLIVASYYTITAVILFYARVRRADNLYCRVYYAFACFIFACGTSHLLSIVTLWHPFYWLDGLAKAVTAGLSLPTALGLVWLLPRLLKLPTVPQLVNLLHDKEDTEARLKEYVDRLDFIANQMPGMVFQLSMGADGQIVFDYVSQGAYELFKFTGYELAEDASRFFSLVDAQDADRIKTALRAEDSTPEEIEDEFRAWSRRDENTPSLMLLKATPHRQSDKSLRWYGFVCDVTERKRIEDNSRIENITRQIPGFAYQFLLKPDGNHCFPYVSEGINSTIQVTAKEAMSDSSTVFVRTHPDDLGALFELIDTSARELSDFVAECRFLLADGTPCWIAANALPQRLEDGSVLWHGYACDVTARKQQEQAIRQSEIKLRILYESMADAVIIVDENGAFSDCNPASLALFGCATVKEFCEHNPASLSPRFQPRGQESQALASQHIATAYEQGHTRFKWQYKRLDTGRYFAAEVTLSLMDMGNVSRLLAVVRDVSQRQEMAYALAHEKHRYQCLLEFATDGIHILDTQGQLLNASNSFYQMLGYPVGVGLSVYDWEADMAPQQISEGLKELVASEASTLVNSRHRKRNGELIEVEVAARAIDIAGEKLIYCSSRDIGYRSEIEKALRKNEDFLRGVLDALEAEIAVLDASGVIVSTNQAWALFAERYEQESAQKNGLGSNYLETCRLVGEQFGNEAMLQVHGGIDSVLSGGLSHFTSEYCYRSSGRKRWFSISVTPLAPNMGAVVAHYDITDRKTTQEKNRQLADAIERAPVAIYFTDVLANIEYVNEAFTKLTGYGKAEAVGATPRLFSSGTTALEIYENLWHTLLAGETWHGVLQNRRKNGELYWAETTVTPQINRQGAILHFISVTEDITYKRLYESDLRTAKELAEKANRAKSEFLANMSHEIRTPMNGVIGFTNLALESDDLTEQQRDYLSNIKTSSDILLRVINDLLDYSKIEAGKLELESVDFNLKNQINDCISAFGMQAREKKLELLLTLEADMPTWVNGDPMRMNQILHNLLSNAIKFTESGTVRLGVQVKSLLPEAVDMLFEVSDTGIGLSEAQMASLFTPFQQADNSITRQFGGTGLGLAITRNLVGLMEGEIGVRSQLGEGSCFYFQIPFRPAQSKQQPWRVPDPASQSVTAKDSPLRGKRILVVEDNALNQRLIRKILDKLGCVVDIAQDGREGVNKVSSGVYDAVLMDVQMPVMDGLEATRLIRSLPGVGPLPIIAMTASAMVQDQAACRAAGMDQHIAKPLDRARLASVLTDCLAQMGTRNEVTGTSQPLDFAALQARLPGFDCTDALNRCDGDFQLLLELMRIFVEGKRETVDQMQSLIVQGQLADALSILHGIKGEAGTIGATWLHETIQTFESELKQGRTKRLDSFENALAESLALLEPLLGDAHYPTDPN